MIVRGIGWRSGQRPCRFRAAGPEGDHVLAASLAFQRELVGATEQLLGGGSIPRVGDHSRGDRERAGCIQPDLGELESPDLLLETFGDLLDRFGWARACGARTRRVGEDDDEFVASHPEDMVAPSNDRVQQLHRLAKDLISRIMSESVVVGLEVVDVETHHGHGPTLLTSALDDQVEDLEERVPVASTREVIGQRHSLEPCMFLLEKEPAGKANDSMARATVRPPGRMRSGIQGLPLPPKPATALLAVQSVARWCLRDQSDGTARKTTRSVDESSRWRFSRCCRLRVRRERGWHRRTPQSNPSWAAIRPGRSLEMRVMASSRTTSTIEGNGPGLDS